MNTAIATETIWHQFRNQGCPTRLRDRLASANDNLARKIAHREAGCCPEPIEDLTQIARIGLLKAIDRYDPTKGAAFSSFAVPYIRGEIQHFLRDHWGHPKIPRRAHEAVGKVKGTRRRLEKLGYEIDEERIARAHGMDRQRWRWTKEVVQRKPLVSLDDALHLTTEADDMERERLILAVKQAIATLPKLARTCIVERYFSQLSDEAIARRHRRTVAEIQVLLTQAIDTLRTQLQELAP
ncbi:MAG: sigma-70 family RNA polymerase sigma factor [Oculatellaceae cyanobacterium bins.114]|nr:sigma-70 family RNA polymerase sigma factor [Oculatellaceae cyanobacterium bins.114]